MPTGAHYTYPAILLKGAENMFENNLALVFADYYEYTKHNENYVSFLKFMLGER
jgi:hypothetical protein